MIVQSTGNTKSMCYSGVDNEMEKSLIKISEIPEKQQDNEKAVEVTISEEGKEAYRNREEGIISNEEIRAIKYHVPSYKTSEKANEYYQTIIDSKEYCNSRKYGAKDIMNALLSQYASIYDQIINKHEEKGEETGITLEEDIEALDLAFERMKLDASLCVLGKLNQKMVDPFIINSKCRLEGLEEYDISDVLVPEEGVGNFIEGYIGSVNSILNQAQNAFVSQFNLETYEKDMAENLINKIINSNEEFKERDKLLYEDIEI